MKALQWVPLTIILANACAYACPPGESLVTVSSNSGTPPHSHALMIPCDDINADPPSSKAYTTTSSGGHTHSVFISASQFQTIRQGGTVNVTTSQSSGHTHIFQINDPEPIAVESNTWAFIKGLYR